MKRFGWMILSFILLQPVSAQTIDLKELTDLLDLNRNKLEIHLQKKGFKRSGFAFDDPYFTKTKQDTAGSYVRRFQILPSEGSFELVYETNSKDEYAVLEKELKTSGFAHSNAKPSTKPVLYQKKDLSLLCSSQQEDSITFYRIQISRKDLPQLKDLVFAEDLLQLNSHEYLAYVFGRQNVKQDMFYFTANDAKKCSIIFPNTSRQAIFLWEDQDNLRNISFVIIGEQLESETSEAVLLSDWKSNQGVYCGMSLKEVQNLNLEPINFYNWRTESPGFLAPKNKGKIDFDLLKPVFNCMNCGFLYIDHEKDIISSNFSMEENQKVYVGSFVVLPEKKDIQNQTSLK